MTASSIIDSNNDEYYMELALRLSLKAYSLGETPIGAIIVHNNHIIGKGFNQVETLKDATAHAEMIALTAAQSTLGDWRLTDCILYVTKEPCPMCAGAISHTRIKRVVFALSDPKAGAAGSAMNILQFPTLNHRCDITSKVKEEEARQIIQIFFRERRLAKKQQF